MSLTGTWRHAAGGHVYYVYQEGSCVWYAGGFAPSDGDQSWGPLGYWTVVFEGRLAADFTVAGRWAVVRRAGTSLRPYASGDKTWTIEFEPDGTGFGIVLTAPPDEGQSPVFAATRLVKLSDAVIEP